YVLGFREGAVFYASQAVEQMLFRTAMKRYTPEALLELKRKKKLTLRWLVHHAKIIDVKSKDFARAGDIITMRDCYVHFQNHLLFSEVGTIPNLDSFPNVTPEQVEEVMKLDKTWRGEMDKIFPTQDALVSKRCLRFMKARRLKAER